MPVIVSLEIAVAEYIDWFNFRRLHGEIGLIPPVEYETQHHSITLPEQPAQREFKASIKVADRDHLLSVASFDDGGVSVGGDVLC